MCTSCWPPITLNEKWSRIAMLELSCYACPLTSDTLSRRMHFSKMMGAWLPSSFTLRNWVRSPILLFIVALCLNFLKILPYYCCQAEMISQKIGKITKKDWGGSRFWPSRLKLPANNIIMQEDRYRRLFEVIKHSPRLPKFQSTTKRLDLWRWISCEPNL